MKNEDKRNSEKDRKAEALEGKSYKLVNEENDRRKKPAESQGSEFIEQNSSKKGRDND